MPTEGFRGDGNRGHNGHGPGPQPPPPLPPIEYGTVPTVIEFGWAGDRPLRIGSGVSVRLSTILRVRVRDDMGRSVPGVERQWELDDILHAADEFLKDRAVSDIADARGRILFDRTDLDRCREFQLTLKERFAKELAILDPQGLGSIKNGTQLKLAET